MGAPWCLTRAGRVPWRPKLGLKVAAVLLLLAGAAAVDVRRAPFKERRRAYRAQVAQQQQTSLQQKAADQLRASVQQQRQQAGPPAPVAMATAAAFEATSSEGNSSSNGYDSSSSGYGYQEVNAADPGPPGGHPQTQPGLQQVKAAHPGPPGSHPQPQPTLQEIKTAHPGPPGGHPQAQPALQAPGAMPPLKERALRPSQQPAPAAPAAPVTRAAAAAAPKAKWQRPPPMAAFQYQLGEIFDPSKHLLPNVTLYVVDLVETSPAAVAAIKAAGGYPVCYFSVGYEDWRPDKADFPNASLANAMGDWPGEKWVDFRHPGVLPVMRKRLALCSDKGFLGAEADNTDILALPTGIKGLTSADQLKFLRDLADAAHDNGLAFGLKNTLLQVPAMVGKADFAVNEACSQFKECRLYKAFEDAGVAIFNIEYQRAAFDRICPLAKAAGVVSIFKENDLKALPRTPCPGKA